MLAAIACKKKREEAVSAPVRAEAKPAQPPTPVEPPKPFEIGRLATPARNTVVESIVANVREVAAATAPELGLLRIKSSYVRSDGTLDPTYGELEIEFVVLEGADGVIDDPNRPTGAPLPDVKPVERRRERCPTIRLVRGRWSVTELTCYEKKVLSGPRCTVAEIWKRAIANGAPPNAVAVIQMDARYTWTFKVTDKVRGVDIDRAYDDNCEPAPGSGSGSG